MHCKAGKGRTGICIAALLLSLGKAHTWSAALAQFAIMRTSNCVGVTIASQRRWVQYYDSIRAHAAPPEPVPIVLHSIRLRGLPSKYANRVIIVVQQREFSKDEGYHARTLVAARLPPPLTASSSMFGSFMCGVPACVGAPAPSEAPCAAAAEASTDGDVERAASVCESMNSLALRDPPADGGGGARVALGPSWRLVHDLAGDLVLDLETGEVRSHLRLLLLHLLLRFAFCSCSFCSCSFCSSSSCARLRRRGACLLRRRVHTAPGAVQDAAEWQLRGDFKIQVFLDTRARSRSLFWCWHNSSFMSGTSSTLNREHLDKVHRSMPPGISLSFRWQPAEGAMLPLQAPTPAEVAVERSAASSGSLARPRLTSMGPPTPRRGAERAALSLEFAGAPPSSRAGARRALSICCRLHRFDGSLRITAQHSMQTSRMTCSSG